MISKKRTSLKSKNKYRGSRKSYNYNESNKKYGGIGEPPVYNESYKDTIDLHNMLETQLNQVLDTIYINNRDSQISNNIVLEANKKSLIAQMNNIEITNPEAYEYIKKLIIYKHYESREKKKELQTRNLENTNWNRSIIANFFAEYRDYKFSNGYFYLDCVELRNKFSNLDPVSRPELIANIKKLDMRLFHLLQLIIQKKDTRADCNELLTILDDNRVLYSMFE